MNIASESNMENSLVTMPPVKKDGASIAKQLRQELIASGWQDATLDKGAPQAYELIGPEGLPTSSENSVSVAPNHAA